VVSDLCSDLMDVRICLLSHFTRCMHACIHNQTNIDPLPSNQVAVHSEIAALPAFFTVSTTGVTRTLKAPAGGGVATTEFMSLARLQREQRLNGQLMRLHVFRRYSEWKALAIWRRAVHLRKTSTSSSSLGLRLFALNPALRHALMHVRAACLDVEQMRLQRLRPGAPLTLDELVATHEAALAGAAATLQQVWDAALAATQAACESDLRALDALMAASASGATAGGAGGGVSGPSRRVSTAAEGSPSDQGRGGGGGAADAAAGGAGRRSTLGDVAPAVAAAVGGGAASFAVQAARRSEKRRIASACWVVVVGGGLRMQAGSGACDTCQTHLSIYQTFLHLSAPAYHPLTQPSHPPMSFHQISCVCWTS